MGLHLQEFHHLAGKGGEVKPDDIQLQLPGLQLRNLIEVADDLHQPFNALLGPSEVFPVDGRVFQPAVEQRGNITLYVEQRRFKFVRHIADKIAAVNLQPFQLFDLHLLF